MSVLTLDLIFFLFFFTQLWLCVNECFYHTLCLGYTHTHFKHFLPCWLGTSLSLFNVHLLEDHRVRIAVKQA